MRCRRIFFLVCLSFLACVVHQGNAEGRFALAVGIDDYLEAASLDNAVNDAVAVSEALEEMNFQVTRVLNPGRAELLERINMFFDSISGADCALFFYAGHGVQARGQNFLIPGDFEGDSEEDLWKNAVPIDRVVSSLANGQQKVSVIILDACRDNPLSAAEKSSGENTKGLAPINPPVGSLIAYSADAGQVAIDGKEGSHNGLYTGFLTTVMSRPGLRAEDIFNETRKMVVEASNGIQTPAEYSKLINTFYFRLEPGQVNLPDAEEPQKQVIEESLTRQPSTAPLRSPVIASLREYYEAVNSRDFAKAYSGLSANFKARRSMAQYQSVFSSTLAVYPVRLDLISNHRGRSTIQVELVVVDDNTIRTTWEGPVIMVEEGGRWRMETSKDLKKSGELVLSKVATSVGAESEHDAVGAIQDYYREVNLREFDSAYRFLSNGFRSRRSVNTYRGIFNSTVSTYLRTASLLSAGNGSANVYVEVDVIDAQGRRSRWVGPVVLVLESDGWKVETMKGLKQK